MLEYAERANATNGHLAGILRAIRQITTDTGMQPAWMTRLNKGNAYTVFTNYVALSQAFPYLLAGAQGAVFKRVLHSCKSHVTTDMEACLSIASYLCMEETGGTHLLQERGWAGLPELLNTRSLFHSNLLSSDLAVILGLEHLPAAYEPCTKDYLLGLADRFADPRPIARCAHMVAHEVFAGIEIELMSDAIDRCFQTDSRRLDYFRIHVGAADPAEAFHIDMTCRLIERCVESGDQRAFIDEFADAYAYNISWTHRLCGAASNVSHTRQAAASH